MDDLFSVTTQSYTVTEYINLLNAHLAGLSAEIVGEVSELKIASSGHVYFTIKDKDTGYILPCVIWGRDYDLCGTILELGMEVSLKGKPSFYGPHGKLTFNAKTVSLVGEGALKKAYELLKKKLTAEGIFDMTRKRPLPEFPQTIGVITSLHGAVIHDFSNNLRKVGMKVKILNSLVEGPESGRSLALAVRAMRTEPIDVLVIIRGGGSIQSLAGFDNEALVREIARFPVPVVAGVGHHQDVTLAALAADTAESTPSLVATLLGRSWEQALQTLTESQNSILNQYEDILLTHRDSIEDTQALLRRALDTIFSLYKKCTQSVSVAVTRMSFEFNRTTERLTQKQQTIARSFEVRLRKAGNTVDDIARYIQTNNPERQLRLGYSIAYKNGTIVRSIDTVQKGDQLTVQVENGSINTRVE